MVDWLNISAGSQDGVINKEPQHCPGTRQCGGVSLILTMDQFSIEHKI